MPKQKDLKRVVRARMQKTGESYTTARLHLVSKPKPSYADLAGMSDASLKAKTGRDWRDWVAILDAQNAATKPHRDIARHVSSLGMPSWWAQTITVGYERIRGLRAIGQSRGGGFRASKSRTFAVPVLTLYKAFAVARTRAKWIAASVRVRSTAPGKRMRFEMEDGTSVEVGFFPKGESKSSVAVEHSKLTDKASVDRVKAWWAARFDALAELL